MRKPTHPGIILEEHYIKPLSPNLEKFAENLGVSKTVLHEIRSGKARVTPKIAVRLGKALNTTPNLWLNLQQKYDLWEEHQSKAIKTKSVMSTRHPGELKREYRRYA